MLQHESCSTCTTTAYCSLATANTEGAATTSTMELFSS